LRIVSLAPAITETLVLLGALDEIVGVSVYCREYAPKKPIVGTYIHAVWNRVEKANPDIVLLQDYVQRTLYEEFKRKGYNAYILPLPGSLYGVAENAAMIGGIIGRRSEGLELAARIAEEVRKLEERRPQHPVTVYAEYVWPDYRTRMSPGGPSFADHALRVAGAINIYAHMPQAFVEPRNEDVIRADPFAIIVSAEKLMNLTREKYLEKTPWIKALKAVREGRLIILRGGRGEDLAHPGPSLLETAKKLQGILRGLRESWSATRRP
jgi:ABC-type Fe3+-hydroxamate transport system substrate-binding protein